MQGSEALKADFLFAGGGLAGLSLAWRLEHTFPGRYSMIIADRFVKNTNDRTWCFWEKQDGPFQEVVFRQWDHLQVEGPAWKRILDIAPYKYKMIRSKDLYAFIHHDLKDKAHIRFEYGELSDPEDHEDGGSFRIDGKKIYGKWLINSAFRPTIPANHPRNLLQHFKGYFLQTEANVFDPDIPLFMDFRVSQDKDVRFVYVIPFSKNEALVEFTVFSASAWTEIQYKEQLEYYLDQIIKIGKFKVLEQEKGIIPMTDYIHPRRSGKHILHVGTAGGMTKPSTGYTFVNIQQQNTRIIESMRNSGHPFPRDLVWQKRYHFYDSILLDVLAKQRYSGRDIFKILFHKNKGQKVLAFLAEESRFKDDLRMFARFPQLPFIKGFLQVMKDKLWQRFFTYS